MILDLEDQSVDIEQNNSKHIYNVVMHILMIDMHILLTLPCQILSETYAFHME